MGEEPPSKIKVVKVVKALKVMMTYAGGAFNKIYVLVCIAQDCNAKWVRLGLLLLFSCRLYAFEQEIRMYYKTVPGAPTSYTSELYSYSRNRSAVFGSCLVPSIASAHALLCCLIHIPDKFNIVP